jgi:tight adherence protein B
VTAAAAGLVTAAAVAVLALRLTRCGGTAPPRRPGGAPARRHLSRLARRRRTVRASAADAVVAVWCEQAARSVRGGASLSRAMTDATDAEPRAAPCFAPALAALSRGRGLPAAIDEIDGGPGGPVALVKPVLRACAELGGPAASALERTALALHGRHAERAERDAAAAQARLSARVLTMLPVGTLALMVVAEHGTRAALGSPTGLALVAAGLAGDAVGWWWMRHIIGWAT